MNKENMTICLRGKVYLIIERELPYTNQDMYDMHDYVEKKDGILQKLEITGFWKWKMLKFVIFISEDNI